jgi:hypothetical protein
MSNTFAPLRLAGDDQTVLPPQESAPQPAVAPTAAAAAVAIPVDVLKLLTLVIRNASTTAVVVPPHKFHKVNLSGKAGMKLASSAEAMAFLTQAAFLTIDGHLVLQSLDTIAGVLAALPAMPAAPPAAASANPVRVITPVPDSSEPVVLSMKQQENKRREDAEKAERMAMFKAKAKKRGADTSVSLKTEARLQKEEEQKKVNANSIASRELLVKQLEMDKQARKEDGWTASAGADKANGKVIERFRDKFGEEGGS